MSDVVERAKQKASFFALPEELAKSVFLKLSVKTLLRCKRVCKEWRAHISDRYFVDHHCKHNMQIWQHLQPFTSMFIFYSDDRTYVTKLVLIQDDNFPTVVEKSLRLPELRSWSNQPIDTVMHCKGVLAVWFLQTYTLLMYNPATGENKIIEWTPEEDIQVKSVAFGFDPSTKSFKYVILTNQAGGTRYFFEVYIRKTQKWQRFEASVEVTDAYAYWNDGVLYDEIFYWIVPGKQTQQEQQTQQKLLRFDMSSNSVSHLILPDGLQKPEKNSKKLMHWNNSLAIIFYGLDSFFSFEVWTLHVSTDGPTWTCYATIELERSFFPIVFWKPSKLLLQENAGGRLWSYDVCNKVFHAIQLEPKKDLLHATCFFESLVKV